jgi:large subunit ribosomal protein L9
MVLSMCGPARLFHGSSATAAAQRTLKDVESSSRGAFLKPVRVGKKVAVVLRQQLDNLGYKGEEVMVAPGYARNFLVPTGKAMYATEDNRRRYKVVLPTEEAKAIALERETNMLRARIARERLRFVQATNDGVNLYGSVTSADVVEALQGSLLRKLAIKEKQIRIPGAAADEKVVFKTVGEHTIEIEARPGLWCPLRIQIAST